MTKPKTKEVDKDELLEDLKKGRFKMDEGAYRQIRKIIQNQPEKEKNKEWSNMSNEELLKPVSEGIKKDLIKEQPNVDDLVDDVIDVVLQNSYVVSEKTSDGTGREYYDNQLFPEKGCEEKVKKLLQEMGMGFKK